MNFLLDAKVDLNLPIYEQSTSDALLFGFELFAIGIATVFSVLILIWASLAIFKLVFHDAANKSKAKAAAVDEKAPQAAEVESNDSSELEIIAAIAAAIAAAEAETEGVKYKVVSFKRI